MTTRPATLVLYRMLRQSPQKEWTKHDICQTAEKNLDFRSKTYTKKIMDHLVRKGLLKAYPYEGYTTQIRPKAKKNFVYKTINSNRPWGVRFYERSQKF